MVVPHNGERAECQQTKTQLTPPASLRIAAVVLCPLRTARSNGVLLALFSAEVEAPWQEHKIISHQENFNHIKQ